MSRRLAVLIVAVALLATASIAQTEPSAASSYDAARKVLARRCYRCHGPRRQRGELRLDTRAGVLGSDERPGPVVAGRPDESELIRRVTLAKEDDDAMPPKGRRLTSDEVARLRTWIEAGAPWPGARPKTVPAAKSGTAGHWAFIPPAEPAVPDAGDGWARGPLDSFIEERLDREGLRPSPEADRRTLIRRVTLDLTGLPPTREEVHAFLADESEDAWERLVDRLLASPRFGEHRAHYWLDLARYGDTHGLHFDNYREMWPYRDWVVHAFNDDLGYDEFIVDQLAGDLLPDASLDQRIASGFNRAHVTTNEGGSIEEEVYVRNVVDRVSTMGTAFMGLTLGCAVCHDHKFDPISQRELYQLFAFFNNLDGKPMDGNAKAHLPVVRVPTAAQTAELARLRAKLEDAERAIDARLDAVEYDEPDLVPPPAGPRLETVWIDDALPPGATAEGDDLVWVERPRRLVHSGRLSIRRAGHGMHQHFFRRADRKLRIGAGDELFAWVYVDEGDPPREIMLQLNDDGREGWAHRAYWGENLLAYGRDGSAERRRLGDIPPGGGWVRLAVQARDVGLMPGMVVHGIAFTQVDGTACWDRAGIVSATPQEPEDMVWIDDDVPPGSTKHGDGDTWTWVGRDEGPVLAGDRALRRTGREGLHQDFVTGMKTPRLRAGDRLFAHVWLDPDDPPHSIQLQLNDGSWSHRARWGSPAHGAGAGGGADFVASPDIPATGRWVRLEVAPEDVGLEEGARLSGWAFTQVGGTVHWDLAGVSTWSPPDPLVQRSQRAWEVYARGDERLPAPVREALDAAEDRRSDEQRRAVRRHYLRHVFAGTRETFDPLNEESDGLRGRIATLEGQVATTLVMKERKEPRPAFRLERGRYDERREKVERATPTMLPPFPAGQPRDRLGLARWLVDPAHPLTARVAVNHFWQQLFGTGLVKTSEDFGNQGERPSHPELLDWLAKRFVAEGWDVKRMFKRLVTSATYRQSSHVRAELLDRDPDNRLLARGPRFRLDAEVIRDQALAVSGLLVERLGGPGVKPPQPAGLWKAVGYVGSNTDTFRKDMDPDEVHRRSLYTFWKRTAPPPQLATFDAPSREECRARRERTNTPLQALLLMNDPQLVEAAQHLAARSLREGGATVDERLAFAFETCTCRRPQQDELATLRAVLSAQRTEYEEDREAARRLTSVGESPPPSDLDAARLAAWTMVASLILNLDEVLTKG